ncbi:MULTISPECIES: hypothetical protein [Streptomyces]|uniref:hypothetical protein n=1 Tax=Streptomyces TaxID=1883 RepID=UPI0004CCCAE9|nr:hypothetical protein [Streptomyces sp. NRRL S-623]WTF70625.1 hypothetical protein OH770_19260 [Streptomyces microflavus]
MRTGTGLAEKNLRQLFNEWDPIGVADEYERMLVPLLGRLRRGADQAETAALPRTGLVEHFGRIPSPSEPETVASCLMVLKAEGA